MDIQEKRRELFEAWVRKEWPRMPICRRNDLLESHPRYGEYVHFKDEWLAFNAALDAVVIELPSLLGMDQPFNATPVSETVAQNRYNHALLDCMGAIESTGLGIKIK